jgi:hypothetical protein
MPITGKVGHGKNKTRPATYRLYSEWFWVAQQPRPFRPESIKSELGTESPSRFGASSPAPSQQGPQVADQARAGLRTHPGGRLTAA